MKKQSTADRLTNEERRTYQSMLARGYTEEQAREAALDGVHVDDVRRPR